MSISVINVTVSPIELNDVGVTLPSNVVYSLDDQEKISDSLGVSINAGDVLIVDDSQQPLSQQQSIDFYNNVIIAPQNVSTYSKDEIDTLINNVDGGGNQSAFASYDGGTFANASGRLDGGVF